MRTKSLPLAAAAAWLATALSSQGAPLFPQPILDMEGALSGLLVEDVNGDARPDLVGLGGTKAFLAVRLADDFGGFHELERIPLEGTSYRASLGDLDRDGDLDLIVSYFDLGTVQAFLGDGRGGFHAGASTPACTEPYGSATGDLDGDGNVDVVVGSRSLSELTILLGDGDGGFFASQTESPGAGPIQPRLADLDLDGDLDIVVGASEETHLAVLWNQGAAAFLTEAFNTRVRPTDFDLFDLEQDGDLDIVIALFDLQQLYVFENTGAGFQRGPQYDTGPAPTGVAVEDLDGDGRTDVLFTLGNKQHEPEAIYGISYRRNEGSNGLGEKRNLSLLGPRSIHATGDLDGNCVIDVLTGGGMLLEGTGPETFLYSSTHSYQSPSVELVDLDGDGSLEIITLGDRGKELQAGLEFWSPFSIAQHTASGDLDSDGYVDITVADRTALGETYVFLRGLDGLPMDPDRYLTGRYTHHVSLGDVNLDGHLDFAAWNDEAPYDGLLHLGDGLGGFGPGLQLTTGNRPKAGEVVDLDLDGLPDIVAVHDTDRSIGLLRGLGDGTFHDVEATLLEEAPAQMRVTELDGGVPGIAVAAGDSVLLLGLANGGSFETRASTSFINTLHDLELGDFNGDGIRDLAGLMQGNLTVKLGLGIGGFGPGQGFGAEGDGMADLDFHKLALDAGDLNGDGWLDLVSTGGERTILHVNRAGSQLGFGTCIRPGRQNLAHLVSPSPAHLGQPWTADLGSYQSDTDGLGLLWMSLTALSPGLETPYGELLVHPTEDVVTTRIAPAPASAASFSLDVPIEPSLIGRRLHVQGALLAQEVRLSNALIVIPNE